MKKKLLTTAILLTGLISASTYHYTLKISDTSLFNNSQSVSYNTPEERTGVPSTGVILASDSGVDWYGEVSANDLISGDDLATLIGLTDGTSQHSDAGWLHVGLDGIELFIAKRPFRHTISYNHINNITAIHGNRTITINGNNYKIRVLKCSTVYAINRNQHPILGFDIGVSNGSEWNRILYRLTDNTYLDARNIKTSEGEFTHLAQYSEEDLILDYRTGDGASNWCQEYETGDHQRIFAGGFGVSYRSWTYPWFTNGYGWRPVLEKVN